MDWPIDRFLNKQWELQKYTCVRLQVNVMQTSCYCVFVSYNRTTYLNNILSGNMWGPLSSLGGPFCPLESWTVSLVAAWKTQHKILSGTNHGSWILEQNQWSKISAKILQLFRRLPINSSGAFDVGQQKIEAQQATVGPRHQQAQAMRSHLKWQMMLG